MSRSFPPESPRSVSFLTLTFSPLPATSAPSPSSSASPLLVFKFSLTTGPGTLSSLSLGLSVRPLCPAFLVPRTSLTSRSYFVAAVNIADTLQILSGTYLKSSVHRVIAPQQDQAHLDRLGVLYFVRPNNSVLVHAVKDSPVLSAEGVYERVKDEAWERDPITVESWVKAKQASLFSQQSQDRYRKLQDRRDQEPGTEKKELSHVVAGIPVKCEYKLV